jgi:hypothetical protein
MLTRHIALSVALVVAVVAGGGARADDTFIPKLIIGNDDSYLQLYGQTDPGLLIDNDGRSTLGYGPVDNGNASTRLGLQLHFGLPNVAFVGANVEGEYDPYSTKYVNQANRGDPDWSRALLRKAEIYVNSERFGGLWLGQGSMASDRTAEVDLSGTEVIGDSAVGDLAGGQLFAFANGNGLSTIKVGDVFGNFDGLGRKLRVRYDTPSFAGFTLSASYGTEVVPEPTDVDVWDIALRHASEFGGFKIAGALAYSETGPGTDRYDGSVSALHVPSGISVTAAAGFNEPSNGIEGHYLYGKVGYQRQFFEQGITAFSVDIYSGDDIKTADADSFSWGVQIVQNFDYYQAQLYLGLRSYEYDDGAADYDRNRAALTGIRIRF